MKLRELKMIEQEDYIALSPTFAVGTDAHDPPTA
jgi:hypothetical protein